MRYPYLLGLVAFTPIAASCGNANDACVYNFEADVLQGPESGLSMSGPLFISGSGANLVVHIGEAAASNREEVTAVTASESNGQLHLAFTLANGAHVEGSGAASAPAASCAKKLTGGLTGPGTGDSGDWLASPSSPQPASYCSTSGSTCPTLGAEWQISCPL